MEVDMDLNDDVGVPTPSALTPMVPMQTPQIVPIHTIYVRNVNYKMTPNELRKALYYEFVKFGKILDIVVGKKRFALRGQAWIIFDRIEDAANALNQMNGKNVLNRPISISFAKTESDIILKREGRFVYSKRVFQSYADKIAALAEEDSGRAAARLHNNPPNNKLLLYDLPSTITSEVLLPIVKPYTGFRELSIVPGGRGIAFVDFDTVHNAGVCLGALKSSNLPTGERIFASYAK